MQVMPCTNYSETTEDRHMPTIHSPIQLYNRRPPMTYHLATIHNTSMTDNDNRARDALQHNCCASKTLPQVTPITAN